MRWEDERYVRLYTRDTPEWALMSWQARGLFGLLLRIVDRAGIIRLGKAGARGLSVLLRAPEDVVQAAVEEWVADGMVRVQGEILVIPNFVEAQEANQSDKARKRTERERARDKASAQIDASQTIETKELSHAVTRGHTESQAVTPNHAVPCRAVPPVPSISTANAVASQGEFRGIATVEEAGEVIAKTKKRKKREETPDPRFQTLKEKLVEKIEAATGTKYGWQNGDPAAIKRLMGFGADEEVLRRLDNGLRATGFGHTSTISQLAAKWNEPAVRGAGPPGQAGGARDIRKGTVRAEDQAGLHLTGSDF